MTVVKTSSIFCDVKSPRCHFWVAEVTDNHGGTAEARKEARAAGWKRQNGQDICPGCQAWSPDQVNRQEGEPK